MTNFNWNVKITNVSNKNVKLLLVGDWRKFSNWDKTQDVIRKMFNKFKNRLRKHEEKYNQSEK